MLIEMINVGLNYAVWISPYFTGGVIFILALNTLKHPQSIQEMTFLYSWRYYQGPVWFGVRIKSQ